MSTGARGGDEAGFSLPEILVAIALVLAITAVGTGILMVALRSEPRTSEKATDIQTARTMIDRIGREIRQGESVTTATPSRLTLLTYVKSPCAPTGPEIAYTALCRVTYECEGTACTRRQEDPNDAAAGSTQTLVTGLRAGSQVFSYPTNADPTAQGDICPGDSTSAVNPVYLCVEFSFPAANGDDSVTLNDGIALRNWFEPN